MKKNTLIVSFACLAAWVLYSSNSLGFDDKNFSGSSNTGETCTKCHSPGANLGGTVSITMKDKNNTATTLYKENETYRVNIKVNANSGKWKGVHASLVDEAKKTQGNLSNAFGGAIRTVRNIQVFTHYPANDSGVFAFDWTPSASTSDSVNLYYAAIAGNGMGGNSGDQTISSKVKFYKDKTSAVAKIKDQATFYPNPTNGILECSSKISGKVLNLTGREVYRFTNQQTMDLGLLEQGIYYLTYQHQGKTSTLLIVKN